ncbi:MAG: TetR/AcrR family transcriptional regulator [Dermatophilaceae bacterium]
MATTYSQTVDAGRVAARRRAVVEDALDSAQEIVAEHGVGAVTVSEVARRLGMRAPSLYKYFPSLHALYDALFARGQRCIAAYVDDAARDRDPGLDRLREASRACVRWTTTRDGRSLGPLMHWRPIPGFEPSPASYAPSQAFSQRMRDDLATAVRNHQLRPAADTDETLRLLTVVISGICSQQMANQPAAPYDEGLYTSLTDRALDMFVRQHSPRRRRQ